MAFDRSQSSYLCPVLTENTQISGSSHTEVFQHLTIKVLGCNLGEECMSDNELIKQRFNLQLVKAIPGLDNDHYQDNTVIYMPDENRHRFLDPLVTQSSAISFAQSSVVSTDETFWELSSELNFYRRNSPEAPV